MKILKKKKKKSLKFCTRIALGPTYQDVWPECNVGVFALKLVDSIYRGPWNKRKIIYKEKKSSGKFRTRMPIGPSRSTGQEFWLECNVGIFAWKPVDSIYRGPRNKGKFRTSVPLNLIGEQFWLECNVGVYTRELLYSIYKGLRNKMKIL